MAALLLPSAAQGTAILAVQHAGDSGPGSFRQALLLANATPGADEIRFNIGVGHKVIVPLTPLPAVTEAVLIDGFTQPGFAGLPLIEIRGTHAGASNGLELAAPGCTVRGLTINSFSGSGIVSWGGNTIQSNFLGTDHTGTVAMGNGGDGVVAGPGDTIGGVGVGWGNLISANGYSGVAVRGDDVQILHNCIGTDPSGFLRLGNRGYGGVDIDYGATRTVVHDNKVCFNSRGLWLAGGGGHIVDRNEICLNEQEGLVVWNNPLPTRIERNYVIGSGAEGMAVFGAGCELLANDVWGNLSHGIRIGEVFGTSIPVGVRMSANSIHNNAGLGIELGYDGVTPNDMLDADTGYNGLQNYPVIHSIYRNGHLVTVSATLNSAPRTAYRIEFFASQSRDGTRFGEGEFFLGSGMVTTNGLGKASITKTFRVQHETPYITLTSTDPTGNTSEFSRAKKAP